MSSSVAFVVQMTNTVDDDGEPVATAGGSKVAGSTFLLMCLHVYQLIQQMTKQSCSVPILLMIAIKPELRFGT